MGTELVWGGPSARSLGSRSPLGVLLVCLVSGIAGCAMGGSKGSAARDWATSAAPPLPPPPMESTGARAPAGIDKGGEDTSTDSSDWLNWNAWFERRKGNAPSFEPEASLQKAANYRLVLDLATIQYGHGSAASPAGEHVRQSLEEALASGEDELVFDVLILPDTLFFEAPKKRRETLKIDLRKLRAATPHAAAFDSGVADVAVGAEVEADAGTLSAFMKAAASDLALGRAQFSLKSRNRAGTARVALSIWWDGRPIEELVIQTCIAESATSNDCACEPSDDAGPACGQTTTLQQGMGGIDSLRAGAKSAVADGALHLIEVEAGARMVAVFHRANVAGGRAYLAWELDTPKQRLTSFMRETLFGSLTKAVKVRNPKSTTEVLERGSDLFRLMFAEQGFDKSRPRDEFQRFVQQQIKRAAEQKGERPSLFVRLIPAGDEPPLLVPFGLMAVPTSAGAPAESSDTNREFLGFQFRIELPLEFQSYEQPASCVSKWVFVTPGPDQVPDEDALSAAVEAAQDLPGWLKHYDGALPITAMKDFRDWIGGAKQDPPTALVLLSHHSRDSVWFRGDEIVTSQGFTREFGAPSLAVLNACNTLEGGESDIIRQLNKRGVYSVIATSVAIEGDMAGEFLNCFTAQLSATRQEMVTPASVSDVYFDTLSCLRTRPAAAQDDAKFGPRALVYALLGNGNLPLCAPEKSQ